MSAFIVWAMIATLLGTGLIASATLTGVTYILGALFRSPRMMRQVSVLWDRAARVWSLLLVVFVFGTLGYFLLCFAHG